MAAVTVFMSADDARLMAAHSRLLTEQQKLLDKYTKIGEKTKKLSDDEIEALKKKAEEERAFQELQKKATKLVSDQMTAQESYAAKIKEAVEMRNKGLLAEDQYARRIATLKQELRDATGVTDKLKEAEAAEQKAKEKATATTQRYMTTIEKLQVELADVRKQYDEGRVSLETVERAQARVNDEQRKSTSGKAAAAIDSWGTKLVGVASAYLSINSAIGLVTKSMEDQMDLQNRSMSEIDRLAVAQQEAVKNFAGLSSADMDSALAIPINAAKEMRFKDVAAATEAMGELYSTINDIKKNESALRAGMELTQLRPEDVGAVSSGLLKLGSSAGIDDAKKASGFMASFGAASPINDPKKQAVALAPVVEAAVGMFPNANKEAVSRQAAAILATFSEKGADSKGESASTNTLTFMGKVNSFFMELKSKDKEENKTRDKEIDKLEKLAVVTEKEAQGIKVAQASVEKASKALERSQPGSKDFEKLKLAKETAEVNLRDLQRRSTLTAEQKTRLESLRSDRAFIQGVNIPTTPEEQIRMLQESQKLRDMLFATSFGEERFKVPMKQIATAGTETAKAFADKTQQIAFDAALHDSLIKDVYGKTPELRLAQAKRASESNASRQLLDTPLAATSEIKRVRDEVLRDNRRSFLNVFDEFANATNDATAYYTGDPVAAAKAASREIGVRRNLFLQRDSDGITEKELASAQRLNEQLASLADTLEAVVSQLNKTQQQQAKQVIENIRNESTNAASRMQAAKAN